MSPFPMPVADLYRDAAVFPTDELKVLVEYYQLERASSLDTANDRTESTVAYCENKMDAILDELERRHRLARKFRNDPRGPRWSNAGGTQRRDLVALAQELKAAWPIDRFLMELMHVDLRPMGRDRWQCRCFTGLHEDRNPSMSVYGDGHVYCHACQYHGDVIDITRLHFGLATFAEAVDRLAAATPALSEALA